jgi:hypothetical protein
VREFESCPYDTERSALLNPSGAGAVEDLPGG